MNQKQLMLTLPWILAVFVAIVFVQSLFFKFTNSFETQHIFTTIGGWMSSTGWLAFAAEGFSRFGGYTVGTVELIASGLLLNRRTQAIGAVVALIVISGAIFFHLFTPLGVSVVVNEAGERDGGQLFSLAVGVWLSALAVLWLRWADLKQFSSRTGGFSKLTNVADDNSAGSNL